MVFSEICGKALSYVPVVRVIANIVVAIMRITNNSIVEIENEVKQIESINRWLKDNDVNTFTEYYDKVFGNKE